MSRRETQIQPLSLLTVGGVNQRVRSTELQPHEYVTLEGVFPEFAGLQSRIWGKRLLQKYPGPIFGIYQFWTPQGYGGGLYQFQDTIDFGYWLTPYARFDFSLPSLDFDGGGMTLDDFGNGYGENFGYGDVNTCVLSFLEGGTDHSACAPPPAPAGTPDDSNGGPAGQGRNCKWVGGSGAEEEYLLADFFVSGTMQRSTPGEVNEELWRVSPPPDPPTPLEPFPIALRDYHAITFEPAASNVYNISWQTFRNTQAIFNVYHEWSAFSHTVLKGTQGDYDITSLVTPGLVSLRLRIFLSRGSPYADEPIEVAVPIPEPDPSGNYIVHLSGQNYQFENIPYLNSDHGYRQDVATSYAENLIATYSARVCT